MAIEKIVTVSVLLNEEGLKVSTHDWSVRETGKTYILSRKDRYDEIVTKHVRKDTIGRIDSAFNEIYTKQIGYVVRVFPEQVEEYKAKLIAKVDAALNSVEVNVDALRKSFNKGAK